MPQKFRSPALDVYFGLTAHLGTHTFYMIILPICFWCGYVQLARAMTQTLAAGVFFSGVMKDLLCIPRPLSPPLQRISKSSSAPLEYGFLSTHSTNAVSVVFYAVYLLQNSPSGLSPFMQVLLFAYLITIAFGRLYCGMHGFLDVFIGGALGAVVSAVQCVYEKTFDDWIFHGPFRNIVIIALIILVLVRIHPEPADDCPCFDDSVAFAGVFIGINLGAWHFARSGIAWNDPLPSTAPFSLEILGWTKATLRIVLGVFVTFAWRGIAKPTCFKLLPPLFRIFETYGLAIPRKYFLNASEYKRVPPLRKDDNVIPPASEIPAMLDSLRQPRRRSVSVGPQSAADAYEVIAFREQRRRQSGSLPEPKEPSPVKDEEQVMFDQLLKPRVRYDVEVLTKLIVYTGIGWLAAEGNPLLFQVCGLGIR
ncbi:MAG: hypothetical protein M1828_004579 [Chrysothrix sp. TS-e1954]|nr:MAG: hypothetical protein M1828_004579 [Chrysothrix sp. TS-e1954]